MHLYPDNLLIATTIQHRQLFIVMSLERPGDCTYVALQTGLVLRGTGTFSILDRLDGRRDVLAFLRGPRLKVASPILGAPLGRLRIMSSHCRAESRHRNLVGRDEW